MVNIIIPTYKAKETLPKALDSLVAQTKTMFIVTIVQDCDGEDYSDIIEEYSRRGLHIQLVVTPENGGPGVARQTGIDNNTMCDYIMFLDSDDMLMPNAIETLYSEAKRNRVDVLSSDFLTERGHEPNILLKADRTPVTWTHGKIYSTRYLKSKNIRFRDDMRLNEDAYFNLVALNCTDNKKIVPECTYLWRDNKNSLTRMDGHGGFFDQSWEGYVYGQILALKKIVEITKVLTYSLVAATLINIYRHIMTALHKKFDLTTVKEYCSWLKDEPLVQEIINGADFWDYVQHNLQASEYVGDVLVFYDIKFSKWIREWIKSDVESV